MTKKIIATTLIILMLFFCAQVVLAQNIGTSLGGTLDAVANQAGVKTSVGSDAFLNTTVGQIFTWVLGFVGIIFLGLSIYSGFMWMTAGGNEDQVQKARKKIIGATSGLAVVVLAYIGTSTVFTLFYQASERPTNLTNSEGLACNTSAECLGDQYLCENGQCKWHCITDDECGPGLQCSILTGHCETGYGENVCENNSDCPVTAPICHQFLLWQTCTCESNGQCPSATPYCVSTEDYISPFGESIPAVCIQCNADDDCTNTQTSFYDPAKLECDLNSYTCVENNGIPPDPPPGLPCQNPYSCNPSNICFAGTIHNNFYCSNNNVCCEPMAVCPSSHCMPIEYCEPESIVDEYCSASTDVCCDALIP